MSHWSWKCFWGCGVLIPHSSSQQRVLQKRITPTPTSLNSDTERAASCYEPRSLCTPESPSGRKARSWYSNQTSRKNQSDWKLCPEISRVKCRKLRKLLSSKADESKCPFGGSSSSKTAEETTLQRAPVLLSCPPPSAVTSARQSLETEKHRRPSCERGTYLILPTLRPSSLFCFTRPALSPAPPEAQYGFFPTKNYAATQNRRDPIRLHSITFLYLFPCCVLDCSGFWPIRGRRPVQKSLFV